MSLLIGKVQPGSWEDLDKAIAAIQAWVGTQEGVNAALQSATGGIVTVPTGGMIDWPSATIPSGWLLCDGSAVSRTTYGALFAVIGTTFGVGDGTSTFNLPDHRQRFTLGKAASGTGSTIGATGGAIDHDHAHTHQIDPPNTQTSGATAGAGAGGQVGVGADHTHTVDIAAFTSGAATSATANPPFIAQNKIIRT